MAAVTLTLLLGSCSSMNTPPKLPPLRYAEAFNYAADLDSIGLAEFRALPEDEQRQRRREARALTRKARDLEKRERWWWEHLTHFDLNPAAIYTLVHIYGAGRLVTWCVHDLATAVGLDPSSYESWHLLAKITSSIGDWQRSQNCLDAALAALTGVDRAEEKDLRLRIVLDYAWLCRDLGQWEQGLVWVEQAEAFASGDQEAMLIHGLLLAGVGRFSEAYAIAMRLEPIPYERYGYGTSVSTYAARWIRSQVYLQQEQAAFAHYAAGEVFVWRWTVPHVHRYLNDMGLVAEAAGYVTAARRYYSYAKLLSPFSLYQPISGYDGLDKVYGQTGTGLPFFMSYGRHYLAGSLYNYAAHTVARFELDPDPRRKQTSARSALQALGICVERRINTGPALTLRGQLHYQLGNYELAAIDLERAQRVYAEQGQSDSWVSLFLGLLELNKGQYAASLPWLEQAVAADSSQTSGWRSLGVALINTGDLAGGRQALDQALRLDPHSASTWFNRGLLSCNEQRWGEACHDLEVAARLAPDNAEIVTLLQKAGSAWRQSGAGSAIAGGHGEELAIISTMAAGGGTVTPPVDRSSSTSLSGRTDGIEPPSSPEDYAADIPVLRAAFHADPSPELRYELALAFVRSGQPSEAREILLPFWNQGLSGEEKRLVLEADRALGYAGRARKLVRNLDGAVILPEEPLFWALVAFTCLDLGHRQDGLKALEVAIALAPENVSLQSHRAFLLSQTNE